MSTLRVIYEAEPDFPPSAHHPDAVRYQVGEFWVDAVGIPPAAGELDKVLADLGRVLYQARREEREEMARQIIDRASRLPGR